MSLNAAINDAINVANSITIRQKTAHQKGQGMTEYIIIVALIAVAAIAVYQFFGQTIRSQTSAIASEVGGKSGAIAMKDAGDAAGNTVKERAVKGLDKYADSADKLKQ